MGKLITTKVTRFDGGMVNDPRSKAVGVARVVSNFDILTNPTKMTPYRSSESGDSAASTSQKQNFCIALRTGTTYNLYGLGVVSGTAKAEVLMKSLTTGASTDLDDDGWATPANNQSSAGTTSFNLFVYYKKTGLIYGARAGSNLWAFDPASSASWADSTQALTYTNIAQGLVASDDILYVPYDNKIAKNDNGSWSVTALTLPSHLYITSICENGNYLAIAAAPLSGIGNSKVFLWDKTATSWNEQVDWGSGVLKVLEEVDGLLVGVSLVGSDSTRFKDRVIFRYYVGNGRAEKLREIVGTTSTSVPIIKQKIDNRLYFMMSITFSGSVREGVWSFGRSSPTSPFALIHERTPNNSTALTSGQMKGFFNVGDFMFISYLDNGTYGLSKTDDQANYTANSIYETPNAVFEGDDSSLTKKLIGVTVSTEYIPTAGQVILKYRKDEETSWTTIFTEATDNSISHSAINIESSGDNLPEFKEIQFQILSTGGAEITGLDAKAEIIDKKLY